jgi:hypothetical protein
MSVVTGTLSPEEAALVKADLERLTGVHALTPERIAALTGESPAFVEQLAAGRAEPTRAITRSLRALAQQMAHNSLAAWQRRISASHGYELLIDRTLTIIAVNGANPAARRKGQIMVSPDAFIGRNYNEILPPHDCALIETPRNGIADLIALGFFEGRIRCVRFCAEIVVGPLARTGVHEFWPIETTDAGIIAHTILHRRDNLPRVLTGSGVHVHWREVVMA